MAAVREATEVILMEERSLDFQGLGLWVGGFICGIR